MFIDYYIMIFGITYFSISASILVFFNIFIILSFLSKKSKKFYTKVLNYFFIFFIPTNISYLATTIFVNPIFAYYRWLTVPSVFLSYSILIFFILIFKEKQSGLVYMFKKYFFFFLLFFSFGISFFFYYKSFNQKVIYVFSGHNYELLVPDVNKIIFYSLIGMLIVMLVSVLYKTYLFILSLKSIKFNRLNLEKELSGKEVFMCILIIWLLFLTQLIPTITNILSVYKIIDRGFHYLIFVIVILLGFFSVFLIYINVEKEETSVLFKINGISITTLLLLTQLITYLMLRDIELNFVKIYQLKYENLLNNFNFESLKNLQNYETPILILDSQHKEFLYIDDNYQNLEFIENVKNIERTENKTFFYQIMNILVLRFTLSDNKVIYTSYFVLREFLHNYSYKIFFLLFFLNTFVLVFFPFFYKSEIVKSIEELINKIEVIQKTNNYNLAVKKFFNDEFGVITDFFNKMVFDLKISYDQLIQYTEELELKVQKRTEELNEQIQIVKKLKEQQEGDYFLSSLLTKGLTKRNIDDKISFKIFSYLKQSKEFIFRNKKGEIGGDNIILDEIYVYNQFSRKIELYIFGAVSDALGSSLQGAFGSIVFSVIIFSYLKNLKKQVLIEKEDSILKECYFLLQKIFLSFDGSMTCSAMLFIINDITKEMYYINCDFPSLIIINSLKKGELIKTLKDEKLPSIGREHNMKLKINKLNLGKNEKILIFSDGINHLELNFDGYNYDFFNFSKKFNFDFFEIVQKLENKMFKDDISLVVIENQGYPVERKVSNNVLDIFFRLLRSKKNEITKNLLSKIESVDFLNVDILICFSLYYYFSKNYNTAITIVESIIMNYYKNLTDKDFFLLINLYYKIFIKIKNNKVLKVNFNLVLDYFLNKIQNTELTKSKMAFSRRILKGIVKLRSLSKQQRERLKEKLDELLVI